MASGLISRMDMSSCWHASGQQWMVISWWLMTNPLWKKLATGSPGQTLSHISSTQPSHEWGEGIQTPEILWRYMSWWSTFWVWSPGDRTPLRTRNVNYDGRSRTGRSGPRVLPPLLWLTCNWSSGGIGSPPGSRRWARWIRKRLRTTSVGSGLKDFSPILYRMPQASHT